MNGVVRSCHVESSMDEEERRARETIALLAKKYQVNNDVFSHGLVQSYCPVLRALPR